MAPRNRFIYWPLSGWLAGPLAGWLAGFGGACWVSGWLAGWLASWLLAECRWCLWRRRQIDDYCAGQLQAGTGVPEDRLRWALGFSSL
jgi:hypothetical protein